MYPADFCELFPRKMDHQNRQTSLGGDRRNHPRHLQAGPVPLRIRRLATHTRQGQFSSCGTNETIEYLEVTEGRDITDPYDDANEFESGENPLGEEGCLFPEQCCMAFCTHYTSECYTPEMYEALEAEIESRKPSHI